MVGFEDFFNNIETTDDGIPILVDTKQKKETPIETETPNNINNEIKSIKKNVFKKDLEPLIVVIDKIKKYKLDIQFNFNINTINKESFFFLKENMEFDIDDILEIIIDSVDPKSIKEQLKKSLKDFFINVENQE